MKRILTIAFLLISFTSFGQTYQNMTQPGYAFKRIKSDTVLTIPTIGITALRNITGGRDTAQIRYNAADSSVYVYTGSQWISMKGTGGATSSGIEALGIGYGLIKVNDSTYRVDSFLIATKNRVLQYGDSIQAVNNARFNNKLDSITMLGDSLLYWKNNTSYYVTNVADAAAGGDTTVFETVLDSTGQANRRVLFAKNNKIASDNRFLFDETNDKIVLGNANISIGKSDTRVYANGRIEAEKIDIINPPTGTGTKDVRWDGSTKQLVVTDIPSGGGGNTKYVTSGSGVTVDSSGNVYTPKIADSTRTNLYSQFAGKLNISDTASMLSPYQRDLVLTTTGSSGAATLNGATLNIPQYSGGSGNDSAYVHSELLPDSTGFVLIRDNNGRDTINFDFIQPTGVTDVTGTSNRITSTGGATPQIDISTSYVGQNSITTLGTVTTGTWQGTTIAAANGGTGLSSFTTGDMLYWNGSAFAKLGIGTDAQRIAVVGGVPVWRDTAAAGGGGGSSALSSITAATATNTINNATYKQKWGWNTLAGDTAFHLNSESTAAASNLQTLFVASLSGANGTASQTTYAAKFNNTHTGTSSTNVGAAFYASGGSTNYPLVTSGGTVGINTLTPSTSYQLDVAGSIRATGNPGSVGLWLNDGIAIRGLAGASTIYIDGNASLTGNITMRATSITQTAAVSGTSFTSTGANAFNTSGANNGYSHYGLSVVHTSADTSLLRFNDNSKMTKMGLRSLTAQFRDDNTSPSTWTFNTSAIVEFNSTTRAVLLPRMTKVQRDAITTPLAGMMVYQTDNTPGLRVYNGTNWMKFTETAD